MNIPNPELLLPAGNLEKLKIGLQYGGDAFFMGFSPFSLRCKSGGFNKEDFVEGAELIRKAGKICYVTLNLFPRENKEEAIRHHIEFLRDVIKPKGIIIADPGVFQMVADIYPEVERHVSVQANVINSGSVKFWKMQGAHRVILPRELMLSEIVKIHRDVPDIELELFVHGAICMAYSGRCLLSNYMTERDSNQGACSHSCRWKYKVYLEEEKRPGKFMPIEEDDQGSYIMNSKDNCMLPYLKEIFEAGICSLKVEGRNKSEYYLATVAKCYRKAVDDMLAGRPFDESLLEEVNKTANRGFIPGYLFGHPDDGDVHYPSNAPLQTHKYVGMVTDRKAGGLYEVLVKNKLEVGEEVEIMTPSELKQVRVEELFDLEGETVESVHGGAGKKVFKLKAEGELPVGSMMRIKV